MNENRTSNVVDDLGEVQSALARGLPQGTMFYVNAIQNKDHPLLFSYEDTEISSSTLHHSAPASGGKCLTFSAVDGALVSAGVDCDTRLMPLCFRETAVSDLSFLNKERIKIPKKKYNFHTSMTQGPGGNIIDFST